MSTEILKQRCLDRANNNGVKLKEFSIAIIDFKGFNNFILIKMGQ
jgi:hypothetical protein